MRSCTVGIIAAALLSAATVSQAAVTRIDVSERSDVVDGHAFGTAGPYERIVARVHFAVDPNNPANKIITDIALAPRNSQGLVEFSADLGTVPVATPMLTFPAVAARCVSPNVSRLW